MTELLALVTLHFAQVFRLRAVLPEVTNLVTIGAFVHLLVGTILADVTDLVAVVALERLLLLR